MDRSARIEASKQWNTTACGELAGNKEELEYFLRVEQDRYTQQPWQRDYFDFDAFSGKRVLEIGIGQGTDLIQFARSGAECYGVDITDNHLTLTQRNFDLQHRRVRLFKADATRLPFAEESLDCVYSFGVIHHIPEPGEAISEVFRVLKPGGTIMLALYYKWSAFHVFSKLLGDGIVKGGLFRGGYAGLLATVESGADGINVRPYVDLYTKSSMRRLLRNFDIADLSVHQFFPDHFGARILASMSKPVARILENRIGWYVACKASKLRPARYRPM